MDTRLTKIASDLRHRKARVGVALVGLVIGLWGIGTVLVAQRILSHDLAANFTRTDPPHLVVPVSEAGATVMAELAALDSVAAVENRPVIAARIAIGTDRYLPLLLFVVDDFDEMKVARVFPEADAFPPPTGQMLIERDGRVLMRFMGRAGEQSGAADGAKSRHGTPPGRSIGSGDASRIRLPGGREVVAPIAGTVFDPGQAPSRMEMMVYGYVDRATAREWLPQGYRARLLIRATGDPRDRAVRERLRDEVSAVLARHEVESDEMVFPAPDEHPHQFQMNTILVLLLGLGALGFLLSAVLVVNLVSAILTNQIREIGTLKAVGATVPQAMGLYLGGMLVLGIAASLITLPLAVRSGYGLANTMAGMLNFEILTLRLPPWFYLLLVAAGALYPVLAALLPVRRWCRVPVREALDNHGISRTQRAARLGALVRGLPLTLRLGIRNAFRVSRRSFLGALTLAVGATVFLFAMNLRASLLETADEEDARWNHDLSIRFSETVRLQEIAWIDRFPWARPVELWDTTSVVLDRQPRSGSPRLGLVAVPADSRAFSPRLSAGQWPGPGDRRGVVASHRFTELYPDLRVGDVLGAELEGHRVELELRGIVKVFGPTRLYMDAAGFRALTGAPADRGRLAFVTRKPDADIGLGDMQALLESHFRTVDVGVAGIALSQMASRIIRNHLLVIEVMLAIVAFLMLLVSALGLATGISTSVVERTRELGVLRAVGATPGAIFRIVAAEAVFLGVVAWFAAVVVASPLSRWLNDWFGTGVVEYPFDYATSWGGIALALAVAVAMALLATAIPVRALTRQAIRSAVSYE